MTSLGRNNNDGLVPIIVQQPTLYLACASLHNTGDGKSTGQQLVYKLHTDNVGNNQTITTKCCPVVPLCL